MNGHFSLSEKSKPRYMQMQATEVLASPYGFIWAMSAAKNAMRLSGSDTEKWTRFWLYGLFPVARFGPNADHSRSAFGRYMAEANFWTPAAVLPGATVAWEHVSKNVARITIQHDDQEQSCDVTVDDSGRPVSVQLMRWSDANLDKTFRRQPFGGYLSEFRELEGFTLRTHVEAGNQFGTP